MRLAGCSVLIATVASVFVVVHVACLNDAETSVTEGELVFGDDSCLQDNDHVGIYEAKGNGALSLLQRYARRTSQQAAAASSAASVEVRTVTSEAAVSKPRQKSTVLNALGPVPLSLLALETSDVVANRHLMKGAASVVLIILLTIIAVIGVIFIMMRESLRSGETPTRQNAGPLSQQKIVESDPFLINRAARKTQSASFTVLGSPLSASVTLPAQHQPEIAVTMLFPTRAGDVRQRGAFDVYWDPLEQPWFKLSVGTGTNRGEKIQLLDVGNQLQASVEINGEQEGLYLVDNSQLQAKTQGLSLRWKKDHEEESKVRGNGSFARRKAK